MFKELGKEHLLERVKSTTVREDMTELFDVTESEYVELLDDFNNHLNILANDEKVTNKKLFNRLIEYIGLDALLVYDYMQFTTIMSIYLAHIDSCEDLDVDVLDEDYLHLTALATNELAMEHAIQNL